MTHKFHIKSKSSLVILLTLSVTIGLLFLSQYTQSQIPSFQEFDHTLFMEELSQDGLSSHFLFSDPERYDFPITPMLPRYTGIRNKQALHAIEDKISTLKQIKKSINPTVSLDQKICMDYLYHMKNLARYPYLAEPLSPNGGLHTEILLLLCAYPFYELTDVDQYLSLLRSFDTFTESLISYENEKNAQGLFMSYTACKQVMDQCYEYMKNADFDDFSSTTDIYQTLEDPEAPISFLTESFIQRLLPFYEQGHLSESELMAIIHEHQRILKNIVAPSYEQLADTLWLLADSGISSKGLAAYPDGKNYYLALLSYETGSSKEIEDMRKLLMANLHDSYDELSSKASSYLQKISDSSFYQQFPIISISEQIKTLKKMIEKDFPPLTDYCESEINCNITAVSKGLVPYTAPAFYIQTPIDLLPSQNIYINYEQTNDSLSMFTTLSHEGYPGHMYQHIISSSVALQKKNALLRTIFSYPGFQEGWAVYVEFYAYDHAKDFCENTLCQDYIDLLSLDRKTTLCLYALADIMIHYDGADYPTIHDFFSNYGITSPNTTNAIYTYIVSSPCNYMKYYLGYLEILECKELAKTIWKDHYSDYAFHKYLLEFGSAPFDIIKEEIETSSFN